GTDHQPGLRARPVLKRYKRTASFKRSLQRMMDNIAIDPRELVTSLANERQICRSTHCLDFSGYTRIAKFSIDPFCWAERSKTASSMG
ncbi:MAG: hypothetical protein ABL893_06925, partial [Hyphomicrobium sp.]